MNKELLAQLFGLYMAAKDFSLSKRNFGRLKALFRGKPWVEDRQDYGIYLERLGICNWNGNPTIIPEGRLWRTAIAIWKQYENEDYLVCHGEIEGTIRAYHTPEPQARQLKLF